MGESFEVVCGELRKTASRIRSTSGEITEVVAKLDNLSIRRESFTFAQNVAKSYDAVLHQVREKLAAGAEHLDSVGKELRGVAKYYEDQDAENAKPFRR